MQRSICRLYPYWISNLIILKHDWFSQKFAQGISKFSNFTSPWKKQFRVFNLFFEFVSNVLMVTGINRIVIPSPSFFIPLRLFWAPHFPLPPSHCFFPLRLPVSPGFSKAHSLSQRVSAVSDTIAHRRFSRQVPAPLDSLLQTLHRVRVCLRSAKMYMCIGAVVEWNFEGNPWIVLKGVVCEIIRRVARIRRKMKITEEITYRWRMGFTIRI